MNSGCSIPAFVPFDPKTFVSGLPNMPGVYRMLANAGEALYVGKARDLKKRVASYFQKQAASPRHVAFAAPDRSAVDAFYAAALAAGGRDHGAPGLRPQYHPNYYGAFVLDPDGNNAEAVCHAPTS